MRSSAVYCAAYTLKSAKGTRTNMEPKIFDYNNPIDFLNAWLKSAQSQNPR